MSRPISELETILQSLIAEHRKLLKHVEAHQAAMRTLNLDQMDAAANQQEASRLRIAGLESKRRFLVAQLARALKLEGEVTLKRLAEMDPQRGHTLLLLRAELKQVINQISSRTNVAGKLAAAVLGHLNTVVRLLAGAVERAGLYTKQGIPQVSARIGVMEAVG